MARLARSGLPWMLVASSLLLLSLLLYLMFGNYLPAKQRIIGLERELKEVYEREGVLQTRLAQQDTRARDQLRAERDALARRIEELERELAAARPRDPGRR